MAGSAFLFLQLVWSAATRPSAAAARSVDAGALAEPVAAFATSGPELGISVADAAGAVVAGAVDCGFWIADCGLERVALPLVAPPPPPLFPPSPPPEPPAFCNEANVDD